MSVLLFSCLILLMGTAVTRTISHQLYFFEKVGLSLILGSVFTSWILLVLILLTNFQTGILLSTIVIFSLTGVLIYKTKPLPSKVIQKTTLFSFLLYLGFWLTIFIPLFVGHMFFEKDGGLYTAGGAYGDLALHSTFIHRFSFLDELNFDSPIYSQQTTSYPFLINLLAGVGMRFGLTIQQALLLTSLPLLIGLLTLFYFFVLRISKSNGAAWLFSLLFLLNGGLGFYYFFQDWQVSSEPLTIFIQKMPFSYTHIVEQNLHWSNIIADYFLPQRTFLTGLSIFAVFLFLWQLQAEKQNLKPVRLLLGVIVGLTPMFHIHTFLVMLPIYVCLVVLDLKKNPDHWRVWFRSAALMLVLALPQLYWQFSQSLTESFTKFKFGWMKESNSSLALFWLKNMGVELMFLIFGTGYFVQKEKRMWLKVTVLLLSLIFFICNLIIFQPHEYDNMKFMLYSHLAGSLVGSLIILKWWQKWWLRPVAIITIVIWTFAGVLTVYREQTISWEIASPQALALGQAIQARTPPESNILAGDAHNHPVTMLAGRKTIMGYRGWLWTHGIDYSQTEKDVMAMFGGKENTTQLLKKYKVDYIFIGPHELDTYQANLNYYNENYNLIYSDGENSLYAVN